jgi:DNA polymerase-3 subunit epsilon
MSAKRNLIVVDVETTGLEDRDKPIEVAAINVDTGEEFYFVPHMSSTALGSADPRALQINRYFERGVWEHMDSHDTDTWKNYEVLRRMLDGNTFAGSNPRFDAPKILRGINHWEDLTKHIAEPWHHRLADLSAYAAGILGIAPTELPGLDAVCRSVNVDNEDPHSALGDARATAECFRKLTDLSTRLMLGAS